MVTIGLLAVGLAACGNPTPTSVPATTVSSTTTASNPPVTTTAVTTAASTTNAATTAVSATTTAIGVLPAGRPPNGVLPQMGSTISINPTFKDLAYASVSATEKLDIYLPSGNGPFPLVVFFHPGGFMMGDKAMDQSGFDTLLSNGYAIASVNYRLSAEAKFPAQIYDAKAAIRFLRANATSYKIDADHIAAWGASAGGNLAALVGTSGGVADLEGTTLGNAEVSSKVQAVVDWFGPIDFLQMDTQFAQTTSCGVSAQTHSTANSPESQLLGGAVSQKADLAKAASPITYITSDDAPFFIEHGTADCNIPPVQGQELANALSSVIGANKVTLKYIEGAGHGGPQFFTSENMSLVIQFLDKYMK
ncbi:MAG: alpha/beta hydrolase [Chloroflexota bacterium]